MTPFARAAAVYDTSSRDFGEDLWNHLMRGFVFSTPTGFVMGRPVQKDAPEHLILDPSFVFEVPDCWHIYLAAGDWRDMLARHLPYLLPWMSWERRFRLRVLPLDRLLRVSPTSAWPKEGAALPSKNPRKPGANPPR